jgi:hypothetical protein
MFLKVVEQFITPRVAERMQEHTQEFQRKLITCAAVTPRLQHLPRPHHDSLHRLHDLRHRLLFGLRLDRRVALDVDHAVRMKSGADGQHRWRQPSPVSATGFHRRICGDDFGLQAHQVAGEVGGSGFLVRSRTTPIDPLMRCAVAVSDTWWQ